jgi:Zn-dependent M28 family amino/carboxypeptidase
MNQEGAARMFAGSETTFEQARAAAETPGGVALKTVLTVSAVAKHRRLTSPNVVARLPGSDPALAATSVVLTAHLDHNGQLPAGEGDRIHNGAYDNAVGTAIVLDVARALTQAPRPRRSMIVALVTAEESGLIGSDYFAQHPPKAAGMFAANVNLDMPLFLAASRDLVAFGAENSTLETVVGEVAAELNYTLSPDPIPNANLFVRSDQYSLVRQGVPAVYLIPGFTASDAGVNGQQVFLEFMTRHYHKPSDDLSQPMHGEAMERFARANLRLVQRIANSTEAPAWKPGNFFGEMFGRRH